MTSKLLVASGGRRRIVAALVALVATAALVAVGGAEPAAAAGPPVLAQGAGMNDKPSIRVRRVQRVLHGRHYDLGPAGVDGRFGPRTAAAVRRFQADYGLVVDGVVGPKTRRIMRLIARRAHRPARRAKADHDAGRRSTRGSNMPEPAPVNGRSQAPPATRMVAAVDRGGEGRIEWWWLALAVALGGGVAALATASVARRSAWDPVRMSGPLASALLPAPSRSSNALDRTGRPGSVGAGAPARMAPAKPMIGYVTVGADDGRAHAVRAIEKACETAGWRLAEVVSDRDDGRGLERPGLRCALRQIAAGQARGLVVVHLRRVARSLTDLATLLAWFEEADAALIALDLGLDTSTPVGREVARTLITLGGWESELVARIGAMRGAHMTLQQIADQLNREGVPPLRGGARWWTFSVQDALGDRPAPRDAREPLPALHGGN